MDGNRDRWRGGGREGEGLEVGGREDDREREREGERKGRKKGRKETGRSGKGEGERGWMGRSGEERENERE